MTVRTHFIVFNTLLNILATLCLIFGKIFNPVTGGALVIALVFLGLMEGKGHLPMRPPFRFSLVKIAAVVLPLAYYTLQPEILDLISTFLMFMMLSRLIFKTELNDYLYGHLIAMVCLLVGALFIQDLVFGFLFLAFYLTLSWNLIFYNLMVERVGSDSPPEEFRNTGGHETIHRSLFGLTGSLVFLSLILTTVIFMSFPRLGLGLFSIENGGAPASGFSDRVSLGDVGKIKQNQDVVMRIEFSKNGQVWKPNSTLLWRGVVLDHYDGKNWSSTMPVAFSAKKSLGRPISLFEITDPKEIIRQNIYREAFNSDVVFTHGLPLTIDGNFRGLSMDQSYALKTTDDHRGPMRFEMLSDIGQHRNNYAIPIPMSIEERQAHRYLQTPEMSDRIKQFAKDLANGRTNPKVMGNLFLDHFEQNFKYSLDMKKETDLSAIDEFLFHRKAGHCEYFASAMVLLFRLNGIPARVVNGFMGAEWSEMGQYMIVRQAHAHSWVEAYVPDEGWYMFDPTPPDPSAAVERPGQLSLYMDLMRLYWQRYVVKYSFKDQIEIFNFFKKGSFDLTSRLKSLRNNSVDKASKAFKENMIGWLALVLGLILLIWMLVRSDWRFGSSEKPPPSVLEYQRMLKKMEKAGFPKQQQWTPREYLEHLPDLSPELLDTVQSVTRLYEKNRFGKITLTESEEANMKQMVRAL